MPHALLLSPDDQAVSAITAVLEEMAVTCERPLDGTSAAQQLHSQSFDLVLVDCENLAAAKLIFDVCRRGKTGSNPVPIAIVDGRAGLPTAFRLGAEQILTKPVARDQARNTIRTAVSRVRKEVSTNETVPVPPANTAQTDTGTAEEHAQAATAAAGSSQLTSFAEPTPSWVATSVANSASTTTTAPPPSKKMHFAADEAVDDDVKDEIAAQPASSKLTLPSAFFAKSRTSESPSPIANSRRSEPRFVLQPSSDRELTQPDTAEPVKSKQEISQPAKASPNRPAAVANTTTLATYQPDRKQPRLLVALLMLIVAAGGFYAAWMYQPGFRAIAQPLTDRMLAFGGMAPRPATTPDLAKPLPLPPAPPVEPSATPAIGKETAVTSSDTQLPGESKAIMLSSKVAEERLAERIPPKYPVEVKEVEGTVLLKEVVDENGKVADVHLIEGNATLATAAIKAVKQWRYRPYIHDGKAEPFQTVVIIDFQRP
jgi:TonB family protein